MKEVNGKMVKYYNVYMLKNFRLTDEEVDAWRCKGHQVEEVVL